MSDLWLRPGEVCQHLTQHHIKVVGESDELTTKSNQSLSLPASILQRQLCPTLFHSELRPCQQKYQCSQHNKND